jgi:hypothetical protein
MQTKSGSLFEAICNTMSGFCIAWCLTQWMFPTIYGLELKPYQSLTITTIYTVISIFRTFLWRRIFNYFIVKKEIKNGPN